MAHKYDHIIGAILAFLSVMLSQINLILSSIALIIAILYNAEKYIDYRRRKKARQKDKENGNSRYS